MVDEIPVHQTQRRLPYHHKEIVDEQINEWIKNGIVEPGSSPYACNVVVTKKKDGSDRVCIDYRPVNKKIIKDRYPAPNMDDVLDSLRGANIFSTIDLKNGFFHIPIEKESQKYLAFVTHSGQYIPKYAPFGCSNSPAAFQRHINNVFCQLIIEKFVVVYVDDVMILAESEEQAVERLKRVLEVASEAGLQINWKKCHFMKRSIEFIGHIVEKDRVKPSPSKSEAVRKFKEPKKVKQVQSFLGLTGYFRKFIKGYSIIAKPLSDLTRKNVLFKFEQKERAAFEMLKEALCEDPVLKMYDEKAETHLFTDASKVGLAAILMQRSNDDDEFHPVYYWSEKTSEHEEKCDSYTLEVLAVVRAIKKFHVYLIGKHFTIITDCEAFKKTMAKKEIIPKVARWVMFLQSYDYTIEHRKNPCSMLTRLAV